MVQSIRPAQVLLFCLATLLTGLSLAHRAATADDRVPCKPPCVCIPNVQGYGFFRTTWREWPCEARLDKTFPAAVGKEVLPTPQPQSKQAQPQEVLPTPKPIESPGGEQPGEPGTGIPGESKPSEGILPLPGALQINPPSLSTPGELQPPAESGRPSPPPLEQGLPGLPAEPNPILPEPKPDGEGMPPTEKQPPADEAKPAGGSGSESPSPLAAAEADADPSADSWQPRGSEIRFRPRTPEKPHQEVIQADWTEALEPASRSDLDRWPLAHSATQAVGQADDQPPAQSQSKPPGTRRAAEAKPPVRPADDPRSAQPQAGHAVPRQVLDQPVGRPTNVADRASHSDNHAVALGGYCAVELIKSQHWVKGDPRYSVVHQGVTYLFSGAFERQSFLADPDHYLPAYSGCDPVLVVDGHRNVAGRTASSAIYEGRLYLFSSTGTLARFRQDPRRYAAPAGQP